MTQVTTLSFFKPLNPNIQIQILHTDLLGVEVGRGGGGGTPLGGLYGDFVVNFLSEVMFDFSFVLGCGNVC